MNQYDCDHSEYVGIILHINLYGYVICIALSMQTDLVMVISNIVATIQMVSIPNTYMGLVTAVFY